MKETPKVEEDDRQQAPPPHFVLVHGFQMGAWCWFKICSLMKSSGYKYTCFDLMSAGIDPADPGSVRTFEEYNQPLIDLLSALPQNEKVILVGHSAGGLSLTHAIHLFPEKIQLAIYVAATMLRLGFQTDEDVKYGAPDVGDEKSSVSKGELEGSITYNVISQEDSILVSLLMKDKGPREALQGAKFNESKGVDEVKCVYIKTMYDEILKPWQQDAMIRRWQPSDVFTVESDHMVVLSAPQELFGLIVKAAKETISLPDFSFDSVGNNNGGFTSQDVYGEK